MYYTRCRLCKQSYPLLLSSSFSPASRNCILFPYTVMWDLQCAYLCHRKLTLRKCLIYTNWLFCVTFVGQNGGWNSSGCHAKLHDTETVCCCDHLTFFTLLLVPRTLHIYCFDIGCCHLGHTYFIYLNQSYSGHELAWFCPNTSSKEV